MSFLLSQGISFSKIIFLSCIGGLLSQNYQTFYLELPTYKVSNPIP